MDPIIWDSLDGNMLSSIEDIQTRACIYFLVCPRTVNEFRIKDLI